jgi:hypothetical protein
MATRFCFLFLAAGAGALYAQQVVAPTPDPVGPARGEDLDNYNITDSFETGYRFGLIDGDLAKYRSDVNYGNGIRLLGSSLSVNSKDGHGILFDQILLNTLGLGNDPYQSASLLIQKNGLYRYDMLWRLDDFYNPGLVGANHLDQMDTQRRMQDHDLTLFPQSHFKVRLGYSRNDQTGPALSSVQEFGITSPVDQTFMDVRREWNEYRIGVEAEFAGFKFTAQHRWDFFKDDSVFSNAGGLAQFTRANPYHGSSPGWFGNLFTNRKHWGLNARMTYVGGQGDFALNELATGVNTGATATQQILISGNAQRPELAGDLSLSLYPTDRLTIVNNTSIHTTRIVGDSNFTEFNNATGVSSSVDFEFLGIRTVANATDINYRLTPWIGFFAGYHYSDRLITTVDGFAVTGPLQDFNYGRSDHMNSGILGVQIRPIKPLTIRLDGEVGTDNQPLTPISERNYHTLGGRADYRTRQLQLSATYSQVYNVNSPDPLTPFSSHSRNYGANASWSPNGRFSLDASYTKLHLDTVSGLAFFADTALQTFPTIYISNIHAANFGAHFGLAPRVNLYVGYSITKDTGDGRNGAVQPDASGAVQTLFSSVETFPLTYQSPLARLSIRITPKIRWNAGWQFYRYREEFGLVSLSQNYRANTGYTSVLWSF